MSTTLKLALVQSSLHWENPEANRKMFSEKINSLSEDTQMVVLPEMFSTGFTMSPQNIKESEGPKTVKWMQKMATDCGVALVGSIVFSENGKNYNRLYFVHPDGTFQQYDKKHTFTLAGEDAVYTSGNSKLIVEYEGFRLCPLICYDLRFPVWARNVEDYDALIYVANWPKPRIDAWNTLLKARAIENMAYSVGVNCIGEDALGYKYPGHSAVYDALGNQVVFSNEEGICYAVLDKEHIDFNRNKLKFLQDRDEFSLK
ncbi:nitrilase family protein [Flagellimonas nanhaiensis]|uniref:Omega-amidase YafV n=1 Tax=Flagellimonas nanhaiensis TaxID=2292706 RepID=A0A371JQ07_9FLAO|nr:nitrilase family protein [Allomuricauda nanhaiensis]RDY59604.1 nitrilase family protein [Allomuricauda nanhaiensis]